VAISTSDTSALGNTWSLLNPRLLKKTVFALSRHEQSGCSMACDCTQMYKDCHDTFVFMAPLKGGDPLLERINFRVGGLWGSENRFLYELKKQDRYLSIVNPCQSLKMIHTHCVTSFRPNQDQRRVNEGKKSLSAKPTALSYKGFHVSDDIKTKKEMRKFMDKCDKKLKE
jgi:hypothetical protein